MPMTNRNRVAITVFVSLATLMQALDTTIANVALPHIQGSVSASQDEIGWVLTSYITAAAIMTPPTGFLAARFGVKRLFLVSIAGFTAASMLCGVATSIVEIVLFRLVQGAFGAALVPLSQSILIEINPPEKRGSAMALWGVAVMAGPVLGPMIGGWLTEDYTWRYVFYINVPIGILTFLGVRMFLAPTAPNPAGKLDWIGFGALSIAIGAFQIMLDRGEEKDWFGSGEIIIEAIIAASAFYVFLVHIFTAARPFVRPGLFRDRNFTAGVILITVVGLTYYASLALQPQYLQNLMNYPVITAGLVLGPSGAGTMASMLLAGRLTGKVDIRLLLAVGFTIVAWSFYARTGWTPDVSAGTFIFVGVVQGFGLGFLFVPLSVAALSTLSAEDRTDGAGLFSLARNVGSSVGISIVAALLTTNTQVNHADIATHVTAVNRVFQDPAIAGAWNPLTAAGRAALDAMVSQQAQSIAYNDDYKLLMIATIAVFPLLFFFRRVEAQKPGEMPAFE
jgi:DHA2 family multidrug resistance protein